MATAPLFVRSFPLRRIRFRAANQILLPRHRAAYCTASTESSAQSSEELSPADKEKSKSLGTVWLSTREPPKYHRWDDPDYRKWRDKEEEILRDIRPVILRTKDFLHSDRYLDGERLSTDDERFVVEKLLAYHPHSEDKIGCGLVCIMVDRHPQFRRSRCLFVVRTDGGWIDFSYQKCLRAYIRLKYPTHAERFIKEHFKRGGS